MRQSIEKFLIFSLLGISLFSFPVYLVGSEPADYSLLISQASREHKNEQTFSGLNNQNTTSNVTFQSRWDILELLFGINMTIIGLLAVVLALHRLKANDLSLISFGVFCFIYGARTGAFQFLVEVPPLFWAYSGWILTYLTPAPAYIFFEQFVGKGWKSSIRRIWQLQIVFAMLAALADLILRSPGAAMIANNVMATVGILIVGINFFRPSLQMTRELGVLKSGIVIFGITALYDNIFMLLAPGSEMMNFEPFGFLVFLGCLIYVVAYRFFRNEKDLFTITHELETARQIQSFILPQKIVDIKGKPYAYSSGAIFLTC
jgi:hypothetical protein